MPRWENDDVSTAPKVSAVCYVMWCYYSLYHIVPWRPILHSTRNASRTVAMRKWRCIFQRCDEHLEYLWPARNYHSKTNRELVLPNANHHCLYKFIAYDVLWCDSILSNLPRLDQIHVRSYEVVLQYSSSTVCPICPTCPCCLVAQIFPGPSSRLLLWLVLSLFEG